MDSVSYHLCCCCWCCCCNSCCCCCRSCCCCLRSCCCCCCWRGCCCCCRSCCCCCNNCCCCCCCNNCCCCCCCWMGFHSLTSPLTLMVALLSREYLVCLLISTWYLCPSTTIVTSCFWGVSLAATVTLGLEADSVKMMCSQLFME